MSALPIISLKNLSKVYANGFSALKNVNLDIEKGEILALLGPNGAGKTTLISIICGLCKLSSGTVCIGGFDIIENTLDAKRLVGLVPQEISINAFETVQDSVGFSRGIFGLSPDPDLVEKLLRKLSLWDKKDEKLITLSGGMKRRLMIAKALAHEPRILFLDEPTAGVDVELRKDMWNQVRELKELGVTIILTTHYIEEAEVMADRVGVIRSGELILVENKKDLMKKMSNKEVKLTLKEPLKDLPKELSPFHPKIENHHLVLSYDLKEEKNSLTSLFSTLKQVDIEFSDIESRQTSLEEIFVRLLEGAQ